MATTDVLLPIEPVSAVPVVRDIEISDLRDALAKGFDDFWTMPTHLVFLYAIYPVAGFVIYWTVFAADLIYLLYPLAAGFALIGPFSAIGLYELSRRRELGLDTSWSHAFDVFYSPSLVPILGVGAALMFIFALWIAIAQGLYVATFGYGILTPATFVDALVNEPEGRRLIVVGNVIGFVFAVVAASISVVSLPLLLDRHVSLAAAVLTSVRVVARNPVVMAVWFVFVALALFVGSIPAFAGLAVVLPILGHSTWHLYRKAVEADPGHRPDYEPANRGIRYAADFPSSLFTRSRRPDDGGNA
ncbi:MAG TPA: DUF2189 domain-containing protein [Hyphomicrobiaceae bacterium]|nr:DUF2189 domain-containing protein [Hyphomicrobiaceae bacterium]